MDVPVALDFLADILQNSCFSEDRIAREHDVILRAMEEEIRFLSPRFSMNASRLHSLMGFQLQDRWASAPRSGVEGFGSKNWGCGFRLTLEAAGSSIAEEDRQPYGGGGDCGYTLAWRPVLCP